MKTKKNQKNQKNQPSQTTKLPKLLGGVVLLAFILIEELWIVTLIGAAAFAAFMYLQVVVEKSRPWYTSPYLYAIGVCLVLAWLEYQNGFISRLLRL